MNRLHYVRGFVRLSRCDGAHIDAIVGSPTAREPSDETACSRGASVIVWQTAGVDESGINAYDLRLALAHSAYVVPPEADDEIEQWRAELFLRSGDAEHRVAWADLLVVPSTVVEPGLALDALSADVAAFAAMFDGVDLDSSLDVERFGGLVIVDRVEVVSSIRGNGLGPVLVAEALQRLGRDCAAAACSDEPVDADSAERSSIRRMVRDFGFTEWRDGIWILDLATTTLTATRLAIREARLRLVD